ncbi:spore wall protein 8-like protein [Vairimorpha necatrix]|uniref:Spore wall protein 8-like protein n=1 Tax=Vairimorpha necatrix TaxID=6039 RepID=A0AAX4JCC9_9MICR
MSYSQQENNDCKCCTCEPCPTSLKSCNTCTDTCFKEFQMLPKGFKKEDLKLEVGKNSYKVHGYSSMTCETGEKCSFRVEHERQFTKNVKDVELKEEKGHPYVEGKFQ